MTIISHVQRPDLGRRVVLFEVDLTMFDLGVLYLAPGTDVSGAVGFGGQTYAPHPIKAEGFEIKAGGSFPRPRIMVANLDNSFTALVEGNDDLQGGIVTRIRTYGNFLDDGPDADGNAHLPIDVFRLSRKTKHTRREIQWEMTALIDQEGYTLPGRKIVRDYCDHPYRSWNGSAFDYTNVTCPYVGSSYFDTNDDTTADPAEDQCSKRLTGCKARFGENAVLPTRAFPGVARIRVQ